MGKTRLFLWSFAELILTFVLSTSETAPNTTLSTWRCDNQNRIPFAYLCNGRRDCSDGSDETTLVCSRQNCPSTHYRCAYGACVPAAAKCDKIIDCADESDEMRFLCLNDDDGETLRQLEGNCGPLQMQCRNGQCIDQDSYCDGSVDCADGSDETVALCAGYKCPSYAFRCGYGACIQGTKRCDGTKDCADGSDEFCVWPILKPQRSGGFTKDTVTSERVSMRIDGESCVIPFKRSNLKITLGTEVLQHGDEVPQGRTIHFECLYEFRLEGAGELTCVNNTWYMQWPKCIPIGQPKECPLTQWKCSSGECVGSTDVCNGRKNCKDGSDETIEQCITKMCITDEYQCAYGGCIDKQLVCNGKSDCADGSDETKFLCNKENQDNGHLRELQKKCKDLYMQCDNGDCIELDYLCDGLAQCADGSDESVAICAHLNCSAFAFRCGYGACIRSSYVCDGVIDCYDGSDELQTLCANNEAFYIVDSGSPHVDQEVDLYEEDELQEQYLTFTHWVMLLESKGPSKKELMEPPQFVTAQKPKCTVPIIPAHLLVTDASSTKALRSGSEISAGIVVQYRCEAGWHLYEVDEVSAICMDNGEWSAPPPKCAKYCDNFSITRGLSTSVECQYTGQIVNCKAPLLPGTKANVHCAPGYERLSPKAASSQLTCDSDGEWDYAKFKCQPNCAEPVEEQNFEPYNVNIFMRNIELTDEISVKMKFICSGAIISHKMVLTAALCFSQLSFPNRAANDPISYQVVADPVVGPYIAANAHNISEIVILEPTRTNEIEVPAVVVITDTFILSPGLKPLCLDLKAYACFTDSSASKPDLAALAKDLKAEQGAVIAPRLIGNRQCMAMMGQEVPFALDSHQEQILNQKLRYMYLL